MRTHLSDEKYNYMMQLRGELKSNSRISYAGKKVEPPKLLYGMIQPRMSHIVKGVKGECSSPGPECDEWRKQFKRKSHGVGKSFLALILLLIAIFFIFSGGKK